VSFVQIRNWSKGKQQARGAKCPLGTQMEIKGIELGWREGKLLDIKCTIDEKENGHNNRICSYSQ